ncbi:peptidase M48 [Cellvibrio sp. KB43]|uniref:Peptidase M48 n=2 Tax=Cellvibrio polysaccharolyticus TaxID=2082724 RepID=A0A928YSZ9_9GAMM|nr:peptidase M48 [Cellvibrio polysaccharolyticus]
MMTLLRNLLIAALVVTGASGCAVNPVTGKQQLMFSSQEQDIATGAQHYQPSQQSQGGQYVVDPQLTSYVNQVGKKLAAVSDNPNLPYEFVVLNNDVPNAWALPGGKMAINRGLLVELKDESQLAAVLGHEIVHAAARHGASQQSKGMLVNAGVMLAGVAAMSQDSQYGALAVGAMGVGANAWMSKYSRDHELEADRYGVDYMIKAGYDPMGAVELQETFVKLSEGNQTSWLDGLFASHPPSRERVAANRRMAEQHPGGARNKAAFDKAMAQVRKDQPAYKDYVAAQKAAGEKNYSHALSLLDNATKQQPKENLFWELKGQILGTQKKNKEALTALDRAVQANPQFFRPYVYRGLVQRQLGNTDQAERDLIASQRLLPTQLASYHLGEINLAKGQRNQAVTYFQQAAQGGGEIGEAAKGQLAKLQ